MCIYLREQSCQTSSLADLKWHSLNLFKKKSPQEEEEEETEV